MIVNKSIVISGHHSVKSTRRIRRVEACGYQTEQLKSSNRCFNFSDSSLK